MWLIVICCLLLGQRLAENLLGDDLLTFTEYIEILVILMIRLFRFVQRTL
jgi:hypothetical protein